MSYPNFGVAHVFLYPDFLNHKDIESTKDILSLFALCPPCLRGSYPT
jgi:hypothetical protein